MSGFSWGAATQPPAAAKTGSRKTLMWILLIALMAVVAIAAGAMLSQKLSSNSSHTVAMLFPRNAPPAASNETVRFADAATPVAPAKPMASAVKPLTAPHTVRSAAVRAVPVGPMAATPQTAPPQAPPKPVQTAVLSPLDKLTALANAGNPKAELIVGLKYLDGDGVAASQPDAAKWLERAAEQGMPVAQYHMGLLYDRGLGVPADAARATHWYQLAAEAGNRKAMHNLAIAYAQGKGTAKNLAEAARWFSKAASLGYVDSEFNLAVLYERGMGVPTSLLDAYKWYAIAAAGGDTESKSRADAIATQLSPDDRAAAQHAAEAFRALPVDAKANVAPQMNDVAG
jgi:localization factor PodJL